MPVPALVIVVPARIELIVAASSFTVMLGVPGSVSVLPVTR